MVVIDGNLYAALTPNNWLNMGPAADIYDPSTILNPDTGLANMLASFTDPKSRGREDHQRRDRQTVTGKVTADAVNKLIPRLCQATKPLPAHGLDREGRRPQPGAGQHRNRAAGNTIQMTLSDWNKPVTVTKPPV